MKTHSANRLGFSLVEVSAAMGVLSVALVSLLALVPMGLSNTRACKGETRAAELATAIYSTLAAEPFKRTRCFSTGEDLLDLSTLDNSHRESLPTTIFASYDLKDATRTGPVIIRADALPTGLSMDTDVFRVELRNEPKYYVDNATVIGSNVRVAIFVGNEKSPVFTASSYIGAFQKLGVLEQSRP